MGIRNSEIWLFDEVSKILVVQSSKIWTKSLSSTFHIILKSWESVMFLKPRPFGKLKIPNGPGLSILMIGLNRKETSLIKSPLFKNTFFALFTFIVVVIDLPHKIPPEFSGSCCLLSWSPPCCFKNLFFALLTFRVVVIDWPFV